MVSLLWYLKFESFDKNPEGASFGLCVASGRKILRAGRLGLTGLGHARGFGFRV